ncbi:helix-turn-helix transcriptional regulator [Spirosoma foliorum]|uniref:AlpA family phage regulatory protein n=1 Tax=Spirosoma foliorum TaxID=2710596 RepID=A0A7G5GS57_9BACT|nr:AlpA family phage regulatory protein [Spirosoma foliorum]QMW01699.1 AlpA family phage regulatory protein [Spirosoma foliorum]
MDDLSTSSTKLLGFLRLEQVLQLIPVSKATWWNGCKSGQFPKPYKLAPRITAWKMSDIQDCMNNFQCS